MAVELTRRRFTTAEYEQMGETGILGEDDRVELIDGEVLERSPIGSRHVACVLRLERLLGERFRDVALVSSQNPVSLPPYDEPQPDVALLTPRSDFYASGLPGAADVLLLVEVADRSARYDREVKIPRYAHTGIREVWLVDLEHDRLLAYRDPAVDGYQVLQTLRRGQTLSPLGFPDWSVGVDDILP
jgi:Uma2 family endonuclease